MADQQKTDLFMKFVANGKPVYAECALDKSASDDFMKDFKPANYDSYSNFFEVSKFNFGFEVKDNDESKSSANNQQATGAKNGHGQTGKLKSEFASWRSASKDQLQNVKFQLDFQPFSFDRLIDRASPTFFEYCCKSLSFDSATLVKRISRPDSAPEGFLRIDFESVLVTSVNWDDGEMTSEKCTFVCRDFKLKYRQQKNDGTFGAQSLASWNYKTNALPSE